MDEDEFQQNVLDDVLLPNAWELNNTARTGSELLFFNRVPKVGSQTFMELLRRLSIRNRFGKCTYFTPFKEISKASNQIFDYSTEVQNEPFDMTVRSRGTNISFATEFNTLTARKENNNTREYKFASFLPL